MRILPASLVLAASLFNPFFGFLAGGVAAQDRKSVV